MYDDGHHRVAFSVSFFQKVLSKALQTLLKWTSQKFVVSAASRPPQSQEHCRIQFTGELWSFSRMEYHVLICFRFRGGIFSQTNWCEGTFFSDQCGTMLTNVEEFATIFRNRYHSLACCCCYVDILFFCQSWYKVVASDRVLVVTNGLDFPRFGGIVVPQQSCVRHSEEAGMWRKTNN